MYLQNLQHKQDLIRDRHTEDCSRCGKIHMRKARCLRDLRVNVGMKEAGDKEAGEASRSSSGKLQLKAGARLLVGRMVEKVIDGCCSGAGARGLSQLNAHVSQLNGILKFLVLSLTTEKMEEDEVCVQGSGRIHRTHPELTAAKWEIKQES